MNIKILINVLSIQAVETWTTLEALTERVVQIETQVQREAMTAWLMVKVLKEELKKQMTVKKEKGNLTGLVR